MAQLNKHPDKDIIQKEADHYQQEVPEQLNTAPQRRTGKHNGATQIKTQGKSNRK
jgi:hypothetical protein